MMTAFDGALDLKLKILDIGARPEGPGHVYQPLVERFDCEVVGFDPDPAVCAAVSDPERKVTCLPCWVGDGTAQTFHTCTRWPNSSSLYAPNHTVLEWFTALAWASAVTTTQTVRTVRLDDIPEAAGAGFVKADVQGAEVQVFQGGRRALESAVVVQAEVEFVPLYRDQPLFAEVDQEMRVQGFLFHKFRSFASRPVAPVTIGGDLNRGISQLLWADAVYVRDFTRMDRLSLEQLKAAGAILHYLYQSIDLAMAFFQEADARSGSQLAPLYLQQICGRRAP